METKMKLKYVALSRAELKNVFAGTEPVNNNTGTGVGSVKCPMDINLDYDHCMKWVQLNCSGVLGEEYCTLNATPTNNGNNPAGPLGT